MRTLGNTISTINCRHTPLFCTNDVCITEIFTRQNCTTTALNTSEPFRSRLPYMRKLYVGGTISTISDCAVLPVALVYVTAIRRFHLIQFFSCFRSHNLGLFLFFISPAADTFCIHNNNKKKQTTSPSSLSLPSPFSPLLPGGTLPSPFLFMNSVCCLHVSIVFIYFDQSCFSCWQPRSTVVLLGHRGTFHCLSLRRRAAHVPLSLIETTDDVRRLKVFQS